MAEVDVLFPYTEKHDKQTVAWLNSDDLRETFGLTYRPTLESHRSWLDQQSNLYLRAIVYKGQHVGNALLKLDQRHNKATLEIYLGDSRVHGKGLGKKALSELLSLGFENLELNRIQLVTRTTNKIAESLYINSGFQLEGCERQAIKTNSGYLDQNLWSILKSDWVKNDV